MKSYNIVYRTEDLNSREFKKRYKTIISGLKTTGPLCYQFLCVYFFRRACYAALFVIFQTNPMIQIGSANITAILMLLYIIIVRPYDSILSTILSIINEILLVAMIMGTSRFLDPVITPSLSNTIGTAFIGIIVGVIIINWVGIVVYGITMGFKKVYETKRLKRLRKAQAEIKDIKWAHGDFTKVSHARVLDTSS